MALPKHKTCLSILRSILGPGAGNEALFAKKIGRSTSWVKKASCGQIPLTKDAVVRIGYETGVCPLWLASNDPSNVPVDQSGKPFKKATYESHRLLRKDINSTDEEDALIMIGCLQNLAYAFSLASKNNQAEYFTFKLTEAIWEAIRESNSPFLHYQFEGAKDGAEAQKKAKEILLKAYQVGLPSNGSPFHLSPYNLIRIKSKPTPQKKQPSRKSKRPA